MFNRRRPVPELKSANFMQRSFGERVAMNSPIQGSAADIMKIAMIRVWERIAREQLRSRLILQIHDELTFIIPKDKLTEAVRFIKECMEEQPFPEFDLPLVAEASAGETFGTMEELEDV